MRTLPCAILFSVPVLVLTACGGADSTAAVETPTETVTVQATTPPVTTTESVAPPTTLEPAPTTPAAVAAAPVAMPAVVCMNLQNAQDLIQAAGVFFSRSEDATGAGRNQVLDRNWSVVAQTPEPGALVTEGEAVLSVVKLGEAGDCS